RRLRRSKSAGNSAHNPHRDLIRFPRSNNRTDTSRDRNEPALVFLQPMSSILQRRNYRVLYVVEGCLECVTYALNNVSESSTSAFAIFELLNKRLYCVSGLANPVTYNLTHPLERRLQSLQPVRDTVHGILERLLQRTEHSRTGTSKIRTQVVQRPTGSVPRFLCSAAQVFFHCRREQLEINLPRGNHVTDFRLSDTHLIRNHLQNRDTPLLHLIHFTHRKPIRSSNLRENRRHAIHVATGNSRS